MDDSQVLPCGRIVPNRLVKAAMYEGMANFGGGPPTEEHLKLYSQWGSGGWGIIITGNVQVSCSHLTLGRDITLPRTPAEFDGFRNWARAMNQEAGGSKPICIMQISHAGRQSPRFIGGRRPWVSPSAPSFEPMTPSESFLARIVFGLLFQTPRGMFVEEIESLVDAFLNGAKTAHQAGFDGIQLHASHGYLLSQFLSVKNNHRTDSYGPPDELRLLRQIVESIRDESSIPSTFVVGIKLNSGDYARDRLNEAQALSHVRSIAEWGKVDFLEISGGDYESPDFLAKDNARQAFFSTFSRKARECVAQVGEGRPLILLTGSIRSTDTIDDCLNQKHADLIGIGRPAIIYPNLPQRLIRQEGFPSIPDTQALPRWVSSVLQVKLVGAGLDTAVWVRAMKRLARADHRKLEGNPVDAFLHLFFSFTSVSYFLCGFLGLFLALGGLLYYILLVH